MIRKSFWPQLTVDEAVLPVGVACIQIECGGVDRNFEVSAEKRALFFVSVAQIWGGPLVFRSKEHRAGSGLPAQCFGAAGVLLHHLRHETAHGFRRLILHLPGGVSVGAQGKSRVVVAQDAGHRLDVHAVLEGQRGKGVPLWHNKDKSENP